jgi:hypothetical protein
VTACFTKVYLVGSSTVSSDIVRHFQWRRTAHLSHGPIWRIDSNGAPMLENKRFGESHYAAKGYRLVRERRLDLGSKSGALIKLLVAIDSQTSPESTRGKLSSNATAFLRAVQTFHLHAYEWSGMPPVWILVQNASTLARWIRPICRSSSAHRLRMIKLVAVKAHGVRRLHQYLESSIEQNRP